MYISRSVSMQCLCGWTSFEHNIETNNSVSRQVRAGEWEDPAGLIYSHLSPACSGVLHCWWGPNSTHQIPETEERHSQQRTEQDQPQGHHIGVNWVVIWASLEKSKKVLQLIIVVNWKWSGWLILFYLLPPASYISVHLCSSLGSYQSVNQLSSN